MDFALSHWVVLLLLPLFGWGQGQEGFLSVNDPDLSSLVAVQVIFRHGARTIEKTFPSDPYGDEELWPNGFHQLTCVGKVQCFDLGRWLRQRYSNFINSTYVRREIHALSSDIDRTIQSASSLLAGFYPPNDEVGGCGDIPWKDIPVHSIPFEIDNVIRQEAPCPKYQHLLEDLYASQVITDLVVANQEIISEFVTNANLTSFPSIPDLSKYYDALIQERYFNLTLPDWAYRVLESPQLRELTLFYFQTLTYTDEMKRFRAGPLFNHLFYNFNLTLQGKIEEKQGRLFYLISGHDHTITSFLDTLHLYSNGTRPTFCNAVVLELHRTQDTRQLHLKLFYKNATLHHLEIPGCPSPCLYLNFLTLLDPYQLNFDQWSQECLLLPFEERSIITRVTGWAMIALAGALVLTTICVWICSSRKKKRDNYSSL